MLSEKKETYSLPKAFKSPSLLSGIPENSSILVGFSGGADSTALLHILCNWAKMTGATIYAAHVNHGIRGAEADRDEIFCQSFAKSLGVEFFSTRVDVPSIAEKSGESIETAARNIRYEYFDSLMKQYNIPLLATAHNADDNLETVIFNLCRGAGLSGICGIPSSRSCAYGKVIRPILGMEKSEIIKYCSDNGLGFVTDSTNADTDYTRNKIRNEVIPILKQINSGALKNTYRMSENLRADALYLEDTADLFINEFCDKSSIDVTKISSSPSAIVNRALIKLYYEISGGESLEATHIEALRTLATKGVPHSSVSLPCGIEGVIENGLLCLRQKEEKEEAAEYSILLHEGENLISQTKSQIFMQTSHKEKNVYKNSILLSIDFDNIKGELLARNRLPGDKIRMGGMSKSVKKLMCDKKIPLEVRSRLPIICDSKGIVAIPLVGIRDGAKFIGKDNQTDIGIYFNLL